MFAEIDLEDFPPAYLHSQKLCLSLKLAFFLKFMQEKNQNKHFIATSLTWHMQTLETTNCCKWQPFHLNTTLGGKKARSCNLCLKIKHWLSNAPPPEARLWGWFDPPLRWWEIRPIPPNHMPETVQSHSNSQSNHLHLSPPLLSEQRLNPSTSIALGSPAFVLSLQEQTLRSRWHYSPVSVLHARLLMRRLIITSSK